MSPLQRAPTAFISYSYDSDEHKAWVLQLAEYLRRDGVDVILDKWHLELGGDLTQFMETHITQADFVILICTEAYCDKADHRSGAAGYESRLVASLLLAQIAEKGPARILPVVRQKNFPRLLPSFVKGLIHADLSENAPEPAAAYELLVRKLHRTPKHEPPPIGTNPYHRAPEIPRSPAPSYRDTARPQRAVPPVEITSSRPAIPQQPASQEATAPNDWLPIGAFLTLAGVLAWAIFSGSAARLWDWAQQRAVASMAANTHPTGPVEYFPDLHKAITKQLKSVRDSDSLFVDGYDVVTRTAVTFTTWCSVQQGQRLPLLSIQFQGWPPDWNLRSLTAKLPDSECTGHQDRAIEVTRDELAKIDVVPTTHPGPVARNAAEANLEHFAKRVGSSDPTKPRYSVVTDAPVVVSDHVHTLCSIARGQRVPAERALPLSSHGKFLATSFFSDLCPRASASQPRDPAHSVSYVSTNLAYIPADKVP